MAERELEALGRGRRPGRCAACGGRRPRRRRRRARAARGRDAGAGRRRGPLERLADQRSWARGPRRGPRPRRTCGSCPPSSPRPRRAATGRPAIGRPAGSGPEPGLVAASPGRTEATMTSGGAGAPPAAHASRIAARTVSAISISPSSVQRRRRAPRGAQQAPRAAAIPASAARCARRIPSSSAGDLARAGARRSASSSDVSATPSARRRSATREREAAGRRAPRVTPIAATARRRSSSSTSSRRHAALDELVEAEVARGRAARASGQRRGDAVALERVRQHDAAAPSTLPNRNGSPIAIGSSWRIAASARCRRRAGARACPRG